MEVLQELRAARPDVLARHEVYITTKYSGLDGLGIEESIQRSLKAVGARALCAAHPC